MVEILVEIWVGNMLHTKKDKEQFDWYQRYTGIKDITTQYIQPNHTILNVGAGNSRKYSLLTI